MPSGARHYLHHADFTLFGEVAGGRILVPPGEKQGAFVAEQQALALGHVNPIDGPVESLPENHSGNQHSGNRSNDFW